MINKAAIRHRLLIFDRPKPAIRASHGTMTKSTRWSNPGQSKKETEAGNIASKIFCEMTSRLLICCQKPYNHTGQPARKSQPITLIKTDKVYILLGAEDKPYVVKVK